MFWKTRWENSIDSNNTPYRTLVCYKETYLDVADPNDPPTWTGTGRDTRFSPPADGGRPENAVKGNIFEVNGDYYSAITVPAVSGKMRLWRNTSVASLSSGSATLAPGSIGAEVDADVDNRFRPAGLVQLSSTSITSTSLVVQEGSYGIAFGAGTVVHKVLLYRHVSGALVFSTGSYGWAWGLDNHYDNTSQGATTNVAMQQATVNLFADMGIQPVSLQPGLILATASTDTTPPVSTIISPTAGSAITAGTTVTISGTASDAGGGIVGGVEVSTDGGTTWHPAAGLSTWTYAWTAAGSNTVIRSRAVDDSGNIETPTAGTNVTVTGGGGCGCSSNCSSIWASTSLPTLADQGADNSVELGVKFKSDVAGIITGIRFYKASGNTGTHIGSLWSSTGTLLASGTFSNETTSGWQQANFASPVTITPNTVYVASYHATVGHYIGWTWCLQPIDLSSVKWFVGKESLQRRTRRLLALLSHLPGHVR